MCIAQGLLEDPYFKLELTLQMRCVIHKYAKTIDDIVRLEEGIGLQKVMTAMEFQNQALIKQGRFEMALEIMEKYGVEEAVLLTGFSREELESRKLNGR